MRHRQVNLANFMPRPPDFVKLYIAFREHRLYPKDREFTDFEAWFDILINGYPGGFFLLEEENLTHRWQWNTAKLTAFVERLVDLQFILKTEDSFRFKIRDKAKWYSAEAEFTDTEGVPEKVVIEFNRVMERKVSINPLIKRYILARIREGRKMNPPVGLAQFISVFEHMKYFWTTEKPDMAEHLQLETLCGGKFFKYLEMARVAYRKKKDNNYVAFNYDRSKKNS